jgi:S1-C subfamily serine protease
VSETPEYPWFNLGANPGQEPAAPQAEPEPAQPAPVPVPAQSEPQPQPVPPAQPYTQPFAQPELEPPVYATVSQPDLNWVPPVEGPGGPAEPAPAAHKHRGVAIGAALVAAGALAGAAIGHTAWDSSPQLAAQQQSGSGASGSTGSGASGSSGSAGSAGPGSSGGQTSPFDPGSGFGSDPFGNGNGDGSAGSGSSGSGSAASGAGALAPAASAVSPGLVDINTTLGYSGGQAAGTGMVLTSDGRVLTNNHVISGATSISVTDIGNGQTYSAKVVGYDRTHDVAVLQLQNASGLQTAPLGDSSSVAVGDSVVGVGNAGGVGGTPSAAAGTVTALNQTITASDAGDGSSEQLSGLIQVNADIQPGDSGGPLVNSSGKIVGIDTAGSSASSYGSGGTTGFAIPINAALSLAHQIVNGQASSTVHLGETAFLGIQVAASSGGSGSGQSGSGVPIAGVEAGTPAASAGLVAGDTIVSVDGQSVDPNGLSSVLSGHHPGDTVTVGWLDGSGQQHSTQVQLANGPAA